MVSPTVSLGEVADLMMLTSARARGGRIRTGRLSAFNAIRIGRCAEPSFV